MEETGSGVRRKHNGVLQSWSFGVLNNMICDMRVLSGGHRLSRFDAVGYVSCLSLFATFLCRHCIGPLQARATSFGPKTELLRFQPCLFALADAQLLRIQSVCNNSPHRAQKTCSQ